MLVVLGGACGAVCVVGAVLCCLALRSRAWWRLAVLCDWIMLRGGGCLALLRGALRCVMVLGAVWRCLAMRSAAWLCLGVLGGAYGA